MKWIFAAYLTLIAATIFSSGCASTSTSIKDRENSTEISISGVCPKLAGSWVIYRSRKGSGKRDCGDKPCGIQFPAVDLICENNVLTGKVLQAADEYDNPRFAEMTSSIKDNRLILSYRYNCSFEYQIIEIENDRLFGEWTAKDCDKNQLPYYEGDVLAIRDRRETK